MEEVKKKEKGKKQKKKLIIILIVMTLITVITGLVLMENIFLEKPETLAEITSLEGRSIESILMYVETPMTNTSQTNASTQDNESIIYDSAEEITINTTISGIVLNSPVKWKKVINTTEKKIDIKIDVPKKTDKIKVYKKENETEVNLTIELKDKKDKDDKDVKEIKVKEEVENFTVEYETPAPLSYEEITPRGKKIRITDNQTEEDFDLGYSNVLAFTYLTNEVEPRNVRMYRTTGGINERVFITKYDLNENGLTDYVEWVVPHLSNQTYNLIEVTMAERLNSSRDFMKDLYADVIELDTIFTPTIREGEYVRVTFEAFLGSSNDITLYPRIMNGTPEIEVYEVNGNVTIANFTNLTAGKNSVFLTGLNGSVQDSFDLRIINGELQFDYIVDPPTQTCYAVHGAYESISGYGTRRTFDNVTFALSDTGNALKSEYKWKTGGIDDETPPSNTDWNVFNDKLKLADDNTSYFFTDTYANDTQISGNIYVSVECKDKIEEGEFNWTLFEYNGSDNIHTFGSKVFDCTTADDPIDSNISITNHTVTTGNRLMMRMMGKLDATPIQEELKFKLDELGTETSTNITETYCSNIHSTYKSFLVMVLTEEVVVGNDTTAPVVTIVIPTNNSVFDNANQDINYTYTETNPDTCWYSNDTYSVNTTLASCSTNITDLVWSEGNHNVTIWMNDTFGNIGSGYVNFTHTTLPKISLDLVYPTGDISVVQNNFFNVTLNVSCYNGNCGEINVSLDPINWWHTNWERRNEINITNAGGTSLTNFPVFLNVSYDQMQDDYGDLRFINGSCESSETTQLDYEIDSYTVDNARVWVRIPTLSSGVNTICMYYNNTDIASGENATGVWDSHYEAVYHFSEGSGTNLKDSTSNSYNGTHSVGDNWVTSGGIGTAYDFDGAEYVDIPNLNTTDYTNITVESWANADTWGIWDTIISRTDDDNWDAGWGLGVQDPADSIGFWVDLYTDVATTPFTETTNLHMVTGVFDGNQVIVIDGVVEDTNADTWTSRATETVTIGSARDNGGPNYYFNGIIDEVRVSKDNVRQQDWVNQTYEFYTNQDTYISFGGVESIVEKSGLVSTIIGDLPFYTNESNPRNITLNDGESELVTFWVNATGIAPNNYTFFAFANKTSDLSVSNITDEWIVEITLPVLIPELNFVSPTPPNDTTTTNTSVEINISIYEGSPPLTEFIWNWDGTNYSILDNALFMNMDNLSSLGETDTLVADLSGNDNDGTSNAIVNTTDCISGNCITFNGIDDFVTVPDKPEISGGNDMTVMAWFKANKLGDYVGGTQPNPLVCKYFDTGDKDYCLGLVDDSLSFKYEVNANNWDSTSGGEGVTVLSTDVWYHGAFTYDNSTREVIVYLNGVNETYDVLLNNETPPDTTADLDIGGRLGYKDNWFNGSIDEVRIYNEALSPEEIYISYVSNLNKYNEDNWSFYINQSQNLTDGLVNGTYTYFGWGSNGLSNMTETWQINIGEEVVANDTCTYTSGTWNIDCSDNCSIVTPTNMGGNDIVISGVGSFRTSVDIYNWGDLLIKGQDSNNKCHVYCISGGCFT